MDNIEIGYQETPSPKELARNFESVIKAKVAKKFAATLDNLNLLLEDEDGVYWSREEQGTLCCFVVNRESGLLYLVTGALGRDKKNLENLKAGIVS